MSEYEIGRDFQDLRSRLERIESSLGIKPGRAPGEDRAMSMSHSSSGGTSDTPPVQWKLEAGERLPPFVSSSLNLPLGGKPHPDDPPQSKTWHCVPEPHIVRLHWSNGKSFELLKLVHQTFSILKWTDPNSGHVSANFTYAGTVIPSGKAKTTYANYCELDFSLNAVGGAPIKEFYYFAPIVNSCHDVSFPWHFSRSIDPGQFDLVGGATWRFYYSGVEPC